MPGPRGPWGAALVEAVRSGAVAEEVIDDKVLRLLRLARQVGALDGPSLDEPTLAASLVLLRNQDQALPLDPAAIRTVAVIGPNAVHPVIQGGGSAAVMPGGLSTPADALREALAGQAEVSVAAGCQTWEMVPDPASRTMRDPVSGDPGVRVEYRDAGGALLGSEHRQSTVFAWWGDDGLPPGIGWGESGTVTVLTTFRAGTSGPHTVGAAGVGRLVLAVDGTLIADEETPVPADPVETMTRPGQVMGT